MSEFLSVKEFALLLEVHPHTIRRAIKRGRINAIRIGGIKNSIYRIPRSEIQRMAIKDLEDVIEKMVAKRLNKNEFGATL